MKINAGVFSLPNIVKVNGLGDPEYFTFVKVMGLHMFDRYDHFILFKQGYYLVHICCKN